MFDGVINARHFFHSQPATLTSRKEACQRALSHVQRALLRGKEHGKRTHHTNLAHLASFLVTMGGVEPLATETEVCNACEKRPVKELLYVGKSPVKDA